MGVALLIFHFPTLEYDTFMDVSDQLRITNR